MSCKYSVFLNIFLFTFCHQITFYKKQVSLASSSIHDCPQDTFSLTKIVFIDFVTVYIDISRVLFSSTYRRRRLDILNLEWQIQSKTLVGLFDLFILFANTIVLNWLMILVGLWEVTCRDRSQNITWPKSLNENAPTHIYRHIDTQKLNVKNDQQWTQHPINQLQLFSLQNIAKECILQRSA